LNIELALMLSRLRAGRPAFDSRKGEFFSLRHRVQSGSGAYTTCYLMGTEGSFPTIYY